MESRPDIYPIVRAASDASNEEHYEIELPAGVIATE